MKISVNGTHDLSSKEAAKVIAERLRQKPDASLALCTGGTPSRTYEYLVQLYDGNKVDFSRAKVTNLDEYIGIGPENDQSFIYYMRDKLYSKVNIKEENIYHIDGLACEKTQVDSFKKYLDENPLDIAFVGIGTNGHIGFNEPFEGFRLRAHVEDLTEETIKANSRFFKSADDVPKKAITMGFGEIMAAKTVILLANGRAKAEAISGLINGDMILPSNPCTILKLHPDLRVIIDEELYRNI